MIKPEFRTEILFEANEDLMEFVHACKERGFKNNDSLERMNFFATIKGGGCWFATYDEDKIVGVSGLHKFKDGYRALYRGCQLYSIPGGLSRNHMNCWMFKYHLPLAIDIVNREPIYITTNTENDASGSMLRLNRLYYILEKNGIVSHVSKEQVRGVEQNIWLLNQEKYCKVRGEA
jgi:hypothetical protein